VIEEYTRTATTLEGIVRPRVAGAKFGWARYRVEFGPSGYTERAVLEMGRRGDEATVQGAWTATIRAGEFVEVGPRGETRRVSVDAPVIPIFGPSMAMFHEAVRRAHREGTAGRRIRLLVYHLATNGLMNPVTAERLAPDTVAISYEGRAPRLYVVDPQGRVLSTRNGDVVRLR
jgi:hypothetical protein